LYLCIYYKNINKFIQNKKNFIYKKLLENKLIDFINTFLNFSVENIPNEINDGENDNNRYKLSVNMMCESVKDYIISSDIKNRWFINVFKSFKENTTNPVQFYWKFRSANYFVQDFEKFVVNNNNNNNNNNLKFLTTRKFKILNDIGYKYFEYENNSYILIKIKNAHKSSYMNVATYSDIFNKMNDISMYTNISNDKKNKKTKRALDILFVILYNNIQVCNIRYKYSPNIINDDDIIEIN